MFSVQKLVAHRMPRNASVAAGMLAVLAMAALEPSEAASVNALAGAVGGQSSCVTFGTPAPIGALFGSIFDIGNIGNGISDCSLQGSIQNSSATMGPVSAANSVVATVGEGPYSGVSSAKASYGVLAVAAHGDMLGITNTLGFSQSGGFAIFNDQLTFTSPTDSNGSSGEVVYTFKVDGALTTPVSNPPFISQNLGELAISQNGLSGGDVFTANTSTSGLGSILGETSYPGFTSGPGIVQGGGQFSSLELPFTWGSQADLTVGLAAVSFPSTGGTLDAKLNAVLSGIAVYDANGVVTDFNVAAASASRYTENGVISPVPEPPNSALLLAGLAMIGLVARRRLPH